MRAKVGKWAVVLAGGVLGTVAFGQAVAGPAASGGDAVRVEGLVRKLGDADFKVRESAEKELGAMPVTQRERMAKLADAAGDPELKARLEAVVGALDERLVLDLPGISVDVTNATGEEVAKALSKELGVPLKTARFTRERFTLKATNVPFWEIIRQLAEQHPLDNWQDQNWVLRAREDRCYMCIERNIAIMCTQPGTLFDESTNSMLWAALDPRIEALHLLPPRAVSVRESGTVPLHEVFFKTEPPPPPAFRRNIGTFSIGGTVRGSGAVGDTTVRPPPLASTVLHVLTTSAKRLDVKGYVEGVLQASSDVVQIPDSRVDQPVAAGDTMLTLRQVIMPVVGSGGPVGLVLQVKPKDGHDEPRDVPEVRIANGSVRIPNPDFLTAKGAFIMDFEGLDGGIGLSGAMDGDIMHIQVVDADKKGVADYWLPHGRAVTSIHAVMAGFKGPLTYTVSVPTHTHKVVIPFEFKDMEVKKWD